MVLFHAHLFSVKMKSFIAIVILLLVLNSCYVKSIENITEKSRDVVLSKNTTNLLEKYTITEANNKSKLSEKESRNKVNERQRKTYETYENHSLTAEYSENKTKIIPTYTSEPIVTNHVVISLGCTIVLLFFIIIALIVIVYKLKRNKYCESINSELNVTGTKRSKSKYVRQLSTETSDISFLRRNSNDGQLNFSNLGSKMTIVEYPTGSKCENKFDNSADRAVISTSEMIKKVLKRPPPSGILGEDIMAKICTGVLSHTQGKMNAASSLSELDKISKENVKPKDAETVLSIEKDKSNSVPILDVYDILPSPVLTQINDFENKKKKSDNLNNEVEDDFYESPPNNSKVTNGDQCQDDVYDHPTNKSKIKNDVYDCISGGNIIIKDPEGSDYLLAFSKEKHYLDPSYINAKPMSKTYTDSL